ncbi:MAG: glycosyltransferase [Nitrospina sp.]|nr:glycosyltransferase [Nitrospina sp.]
MTSKPPEKIRVLVIATTFPRWEDDQEPRFVYNLCQNLPKEVDIHVLAPHAPNAKEQETWGEIKITRFPYFYPKYLQKLCYDGGIIPKLKSSWLARVQLPFFLFFLFIRLIKMTANNRFDLIHCHWLIPQGFFCALIKFFRGTPYLLTAHGGDVYSFKGIPVIPNLIKFALKRSTFCTVNSQATRNQVLKFSKNSSIKVVPMGVDLKEFHPGNYNEKFKASFGEKNLLLLGVGRLADKKGFKYLIEAMPLILQEIPSAKLVIIGFGPQKARLENQIQQLELASSISLIGGKTGKELQDWFASADIFIGPSIITADGDTEGQGVVFLEAMASGTAVIASDVGGIKDAVRDNISGLLVPEKNPQAIAEKVLTLAKNNQLKEKLIQNALELVRSDYSGEQLSQKFLTLYTQCLEKD